MKRVTKTSRLSFRKKRIKHKQQNKILIPAVLALIFLTLSLVLPWHTGILMGRNYQSDVYLTRSELHNGSVISTVFSDHDYDYYSEFKALSYGTLTAIIIALMFTGCVLILTIKSLKGSMKSERVLSLCLIALSIVFIALSVYSLRYTPTLDTGKDTWIQNYINNHPDSDTNLAAIGTNDFFKIPNLNKWTWIAFPGIGWFMALLGGINLVIAFVNTLKLHRRSRASINPGPINEKAF